MPDIQRDQELLVDLIRDSWTKTPIAYQNKPFTPPAQTGDSDSPARFIQHSIEYDNAERITFGDVQLRQGVIRTSVWIEENGGESKAKELLDDLVAIVRAADLRSDGISLFAGSPNRLGWVPAPHGNWYVWDLQFPFWSTLT